MTTSTIDAVNAYYDFLERYVSEEQRRVVQCLEQELQNTLAITATRETRIAVQKNEMEAQEGILSSLEDENASLRMELERYRKMDSSINLTDSLY